MPRMNSEQTHVQIVLHKDTKRALKRWLEDNGYSSISDFFRMAGQQVLNEKGADHIEMHRGVEKWGDTKRSQE